MSEVRVAPEAPSPTLRTQPDFLRLWAGQSISTLGTSISSVTLPLVAVVTLNASAMQVGLLNFAQTLPALPLTLFIGVLVDRVRRRRLLIAADLVRGCILGLIPILALAGGLRIEVMYVCMLALGVMTMVFDVAYMSYLPQLLPRPLLVAANSRLALSRNVLSLAGKGIAGAAVSVMRVPLVVAVDAVSYFCSATCLALIRKTDQAPAASTKPVPLQVLREIREGIDGFLGNRYLRPVAINAAATNFLTQIILTLFVLYATRDLHLAAGWIGLIFAAGSIGGVVGSLLVPRVMDWLGYGRTFLGFMVLLRAGLLCVGLVRGPQPVVIACLTALWFVTLIGLVGSNVCLATLRQVAVRDEMRGRTNAALLTLILGVTPMGALLAGVAGSAIGTHLTILLAALAMPIPLLLVIFSPVRTMQSVSEAAPDTS